MITGEMLELHEPKGLYHMEYSGVVNVDGAFIG
jgi:hypothetical protein